MKKSVKKILYWSPRIVGVLIAVLLGFSALTVINDGGTLWDTALSLMSYFIPVAIFVIILVLAWEWDWVAILFIIASPMFLIWKWELYPSNSFYISSGILFIAGVLFLANWLITKKFTRSH